MAQSRRSFRNNPLFTGQVQSRFLLVCLVLGTAVFALFAMICLSGVTSTLTSLSMVYQIPPELIESLDSSIRHAMLFVGVGGLLVTAIGIALGFVLTTRVYGPMVSVKRVLGDMVEGRFGETVRTRKGDEFTEVVSLVNQLSTKLADPKN